MFSMISNMYYLVPKEFDRPKSVLSENTLLGKLYGLVERHMLPFLILVFSLLISMDKWMIKILENFQRKVV